LGWRHQPGKEQKEEGPIAPGGGSRHARQRTWRSKRSPPHSRARETAPQPRPCSRHRCHRRRRPDRPSRHLQHRQHQRQRRRWWRTRPTREGTRRRRASHHRPRGGVVDRGGQKKGAAEQQKGGECGHGPPVDQGGRFSVTLSSALLWGVSEQPMIPTPVDHLLEGAQLRGNLFQTLPRVYPEAERVPTAAGQGAVVDRWPVSLLPRFRDRCVCRWLRMQTRSDGHLTRTAQTRTLQNKTKHMQIPCIVIPPPPPLGCGVSATINQRQQQTAASRSNAPGQHGDAQHAPKFTIPCTHAAWHKKAHGQTKASNTAGGRRDKRAVKKHAHHGTANAANPFASLTMHA